MPMAHKSAARKTAVYSTVICSLIQQRYGPIIFIISWILSNQNTFEHLL